MTDHYELLQISPNADTDTIHRVYRFLAARVHPDHQQTGDVDMFRQLKEAYDVLSNPAKREAYDIARKPPTPEPFSLKVDFMDQRDGELNRRLAVLAVLYHRRRSAPNYPEVALAEIEERMGFPRDYLDFTLWYLQRKGYLVKADNAQFALTADGVDFVESERAKLPILNRLLTSSTSSYYPAEPITKPGAPENGTTTTRVPASLEETNPVDDVIVVPANMGSEYERRTGQPDRRAGAPDTRKYKIDRRKNSSDRRTTRDDRRTGDAVDRRSIN